MLGFFFLSRLSLDTWHSMTDSCGVEGQHSGGTRMSHQNNAQCTNETKKDFRGEQKAVFSNIVRLAAFSSYLNTEDKLIGLCNMIAKISGFQL